MVAAYARSLKAKVKQSLVAQSGQSSVVSRAYFAVINKAFVREQMSVAAGQDRYRRDLEASLPSYPQLRRNVHRLEKGLVMRPRRRVFGLDYLNDTLDLFARALNAQPQNWNSETTWAHDVFVSYFAAVDHSNEKVSAALEKFQTIVSQAMPRETTSFSPYRRDLERPVSVGIDAFEALTRRRRSVRWYLDKPVPREMIDRAVSAAAQAPSACNRQSFVLHIFDEPEKARDVARLAMGTAGFGAHLPAIAVVVGRLRAYPHERDRHAIYVDGALAAMSFMFAAETMNLATCAINWPDIAHRDVMMEQALALEPDERVVMLIAFGWPDPDGMVPFSSKRELSQLRVYD